MTVEVGILNKHAVALAADSAVTIDGDHGTKIYNTVNKIFALSKRRPVGIMAYSSATIMGAPIETAIKVFRAKLDGEPAFDTLEQYSDRFIDYLMNDNSIFPERARIDGCAEVIYKYFKRLSTVISRKARNRYPVFRGATKAQLASVARSVLKERNSGFESSPALSGSTAEVEQFLAQEMLPVIEYWQDTYQSSFFLSDVDVGLLHEISLKLLLREKETDIETGFVIAGFGEQEYFPQLRSFEFQTSVRNVHKYQHKEIADLSTESARIIPFGQSDMVETFTHGRDQEIDPIIANLVNSFFEEEKKRLANTINVANQKKIVNQVLDNLNSNLQDHILQKLTDFTKRYYTEPIEYTVSAMPKEELCVMAEALVNITSIKRRMSMDAETVGGPTDVAVISKGDGFVWIKRKHYFKPELNPPFFHNYFREETRLNEAVQP